jgi:predicted nucleotidyltransferase
MPTFPTPYSDVNAALERFLSNLHEVLREQLVGVYLHGSLASGDFNPKTSDIDFLVATTSTLPAGTFSALKAMHARLAASELEFASRLEGAYMPLAALRRYHPDAAPQPWLGVDGHFAEERTGSDWIIQRWILREQGVVLYGPDPRTLIDPISPEDLRGAVRASLCEWWSPPFPSPERFDSSEYQAYTVLTMCRALYTLQTGAVASKPASAHWAQQTLGSQPPWGELIEWALAWQPEIHEDRKEETLGLIHYTLEHI